MSYLYDKSFAIMKCNTWEEKIMIERLFSAVEQMIIQIVPQMVEKYMNEHKDKLILEIETMINGKMINSDNIVGAIQDAIARQLSI